MQTQVKAKFDAPKEFQRIQNAALKTQCKKEIGLITGVNDTTVLKYLSRGISHKSPYIETVASIISKYQEMFKKLLEENDVKLIKS